MRVMRQGTTRRGLIRGGGALGAATLTATLAACAPGQAPAPPAPARPQGKVYHMSRADPYILDLFKEQARAFTAEHPDVQVEIDHQEQAAWLEKFKTMVASGSPLDTAFANDSNDVLFARDGLVADLDPFLARQKDFNEADFAEGSWFAMRFQGKRFGLPWDSGAYGLFFNLDLFDAAGVPYLDPKKRLTWDELLGIARRLTLDGNGRHPNEGGFDPAGVRQYGFATSLTFGLANFVFANGGEMLTGEGKVGLEQPQAIEAIQFLADLRSRHYVWSAPQFAPPQPIGFRTNNLAIDHNGAWNLGRYAQDVQRVGIAPAPFKRRAASGGHYSPLVLTRHAQNRDAAWAWMYFACLSETGQGMLSDAGQMQPNRLSLAQRFVNAPGGKVEGKYRQVLIDEMTGGALRVPGDRVGTYWGGYPGWGPVLTPLLTPVWRGEVSAAQAMPEIRRLTEQYLQTGQPPVINQP